MTVPSEETTDEAASTSPPRYRSVPAAAVNVPVLTVLPWPSNGAPVLDDDGAGVGEGDGHDGPGRHDERAGVVERRRRAVLGVHAIVVALLAGHGEGAPARLLIAGRRRGRSRRRIPAESVQVASAWLLSVVPSM